MPITVFPRDKRTVRMPSLLQGLRLAGYKTENIGEYKKWIEVYAGRVTVTIRLYKISNATETFYMMSDSLDRVVAPANKDYIEVLNWIIQHNYKEVKIDYDDVEGDEE